MKADLEAIIRHDGRVWTVDAAGLSVSGLTLPELDRTLAAALRRAGRFAPGARVRVFMGFDHESLPRWLWQYASHYFNRSVDLEIS